MPQILPEKINIVSINVTNANVTLNTGKDLFKEAAFNVEFETSLALAKEDVNVCRIEFTAIFSPLKELEAETDFSARFSIEFFFSIENLEDFKVGQSDNETGQLLDGTMAATLMGIVYSTARGIILTRTAGTLIDGIILPVLNPAILLPKQAGKNPE